MGEIKTEKQFHNQVASSTDIETLDLPDLVTIDEDTAKLDVIRIGEAVDSELVLENRDLIRVRDYLNASLERRQEEVVPGMVINTGLFSDNYGIVEDIRFEPSEHWYQHDRLIATVIDSAGQEHEINIASGSLEVLTPTDGIWESIRTHITSELQEDLLAVMTASTGTVLNDYWREQVYGRWNLSAGEILVTFDEQGDIANSQLILSRQGDNVTLLNQDGSIATEEFSREFLGENLGSLYSFKPYEDYTFDNLVIHEPEATAAEARTVEALPQSLTAEQANLLGRLNYNTHETLDYLEIENPSDIEPGQVIQAFSGETALNTYIVTDVNRESRTITATTYTETLVPGTTETQYLGEAQEISFSSFGNNQYLTYKLVSPQEGSSWEDTF